MDKELRILILENVPADAELEEHELRNAGLVFTSKIVDTREAFLEALEEFLPDLILSDYKLPSFDGLAALRIAKEKCPDVPFILVTGKLGEEFAIKKLKEGATDYVLKNNLKRLVPSVNRALEEAKQIRERKRVELETHWKTALLEAQLNATIDGILIVDEKGNKVIQNQRCIDLWKIPQHIVDNRDDKQQVEFVMNRAKDPQKFVEKVIYLYTHPNETSQEELEFKDGTILDRYSAPVIGKDGTYFGRIWIFRDVTERRQAEEALRASDAQLRAILDATPFPIALVDLEDNKIDFWSRSALTLFGHTGATAAEWYQIAYPDPNYRREVIKRWKPMLEKAHSSGKTINTGEYRVTCRDGSVRICELYAAFLANKFIVTFNDITERKRAEESLKLRAQLLNAANDSIYLHDFDGKFVYANEAAYKSRGYTEDELMAINLHDFVVSDYAPLIKPRITELMEKGEATFESAHICKDGSFMSVEVRARLIEVGGKKLILSIARDITERKKAEKALKTSEVKFRSISNTAADAILLMDNDGKITYWNPSAEKVFGYTNNETIGKDLHNLLVPERYHKDFKKGFERFKETGQGPVTGKTLELSAIRKDGTEFPIDLSVSATQIDNKWCAVGIIRDITKRKKAEDALRVSEAELHDNYFSQSAINVILSESLENIPLEEILQKALNMILAIPWITFESVGSISLVEDEADVLVMKAQSNLDEPSKKLCARVPFGKCLCGKAAQSQKIEFADHIDERHEICYKGIQPHGQYSVPILFSGRTLGVLNIYLKEGHIRDKKEEEFLRTVADTLAGIIVRRQVEYEKEKLYSQFLQAQKMEAVGQLAGGIAHDFNNILTAMIGYGHLLKMKLKEEDLLRNYADHILSLSDKAANLTKSLVAFGRKQIINPRPVDLNGIIRRIDHLLSRIIGEDIRLQTMLSENDLIVMVDPGQIEQVLMNLATNAKDAMPGGGLLTIRAETADIDHEYIREHGFGKEGKYALISFTDTGSGMARETREKIFEPFFTTKEVGKGTGLGLAMVYGIIKQNEGYINVYSEPGIGTTFRIYLPLIQAKAEEIEPKEVIHHIERGTETVLLAEDETAVREFTRELLEENGYTVIEAIDGQDAVNRFKENEDKIQFVLLDVIMPNKNGKEVYDEIKQIRPGIKVLFMSGYPADIIHKHGIIEKEFAYIEKPASPTKLLQKIREVLRK